MVTRTDETQPRKCSICAIVKLPSAFYDGNRRVDGTQCKGSRCKQCIREYYRKHNKGLRAIPSRDMEIRLRTSRKDAKERGHLPCFADVDELASSFTGRCFICGVPEIECAVRLVMDHDHATGQFRGWLCHKCNRALGLINDSTDVAVKLGVYLENSGTICYT